MTFPSLLDHLLSSPGLLVCGVLVLGFAYVAWRKLLQAADADRKAVNEWRASRQQFMSPDSSSLADDTDPSGGAANERK